MYIHCYGIGIQYKHVNVYLHKLYRCIVHATTTAFELNAHNIIYV